MTRAPVAWCGDQRALDAVQRARSLGRTMLAVEVVCPGQHPLAEVWMTDEGDVCTFRPEYGKRDVYESLFPDDPAAELTGTARDEQSLEVQFVAEMEPTTALFCRCWRGQLDRDWLAGEVKSRRNLTTRSGGRVGIPANAQRLR